MNKNKQELHWQPISFLPHIREMIDGMLESAEENLLNFTGIEDRSPVFDDYTVGRMFEVYGNQKRDFWLYDDQLQRWQCTRLNDLQEKEIKRLQVQMVKLKNVVDKLLNIAEQLKDNTIETVLGKDDFELAMEVLTGKRQMPL
ncbi:MAG: hypothetical protein HQK63_10690 [Desulfamplus sp.]|nr:hypothetical protein [Desulfamplus sp.]